MKEQLRTTYVVKFYRFILHDNFQEFSTLEKPNNIKI